MLLGLLGLLALLILAKIEGPPKPTHLKYRIHPQIGTYIQLKNTKNMTSHLEALY